MDTSDGSVNRIGRTIWTVWGYLSGAVARYLSPEVTDNGNQSVNSRADTVNRNTAKNTDRPVKEIDAEKHKEETKYNPAEARYHVATVEWEKTDVVQEDNNELRVDTTITESYHCKTDDKQTDEAIDLDVQVNYENEEKQTKDEAHIEKEVAISIKHRANIELDGCERKQELKETEDTEQKDGKEDFDHYNEDDGEEGVMRTEDLDDTEVTNQSVQDVDQKTLMSKMEYEETENIRIAEDAGDLLGENVVKYVFEKEEQIIYTDQEKTESVEDKETESLVEDEGLPSSLGSLTQDEEDLLKPLENKRLSLLDEYPNFSENEGEQTPEKQVIDDISKNVVEIPRTTATSEPDENIEEDEQQKCLDTGESPTTEMFGEKEAHEQMLGEIRTQSLLESVETPSGGSKEIFDDSIAHNEIGLKTLLHEVVYEICDASEDTLQSDFLKQDSPETENHSDLTGCDLPQEPSNRPAIGLVNSGDLDQITAVATSLGSFEEMKANISELHIQAEDRLQSSDMTQYEPLNETFVKATEFETPMLSLEIGAKPIQTLQEMAKCSLKECVELRSEQIGETMKTETDLEDKGEVLMTGSEANNEILELNIEKEGILSQATMETISESLNQDKCEASERDVNRTELVEDSPDPAEAKTELLKSEVLEETQYLQGKSERYTENIKTEVGLLSETDTTITQSNHCKTDDKQTDEAIDLDVQVNYENEEKQTKNEAHIEKEFAISIKHRANIELDGCERKQELKETEDTEQKDGKEDFDHYNEDDGEEGVMRTEALDDTEVTNQSVQDVDQKTLMNKMEYEETENIRIAEDAGDLLGENVVKYVFEKEEQIIYTDQEKTESVEDKETESLVKDEGLPSSLGSLTQDEEDLLKPLENKRLSLLDAYPNILENEGIQTPERQVIDDISKNVVEIPGTTATSEPDENIEEDEQQKCLDAGESPTTNVFGEKEAHEIQTQSLLESVETPSGGSKEIFDDSIAHNEIGLKTSTSVNEVADEICDASEDTLQSDLLKQNSTETANHSERTVCDLPQEPSNRPAIGLVNSGDLDQITAVATSLGSFEEMKANISELHIQPEDRSQSSDMTQYEPLNETFVKAAEFETPMLSLEIGAKQIQTLQEMAKCSLIECVELRSEQIGETMKTETDSEDKGEVLMTGSEANNEILELNIEKEGILSQATMETISESLNQDKYESSEHDVNRTELVEDTPDPAEAKTELLKSEVLEETQYLQGKSERYTENIKTEVGLLSETDTTITESNHCKTDDKQTDEAIDLDVQVNYENEEKQTKNEAHIEKEVAISIKHRANIELDGCERKQELKETEDTEQKDGKEDFDHYNEDDGEEGVMRTEALDDTEVTDQSVQDVDQKTLMNKMEYEETENIRIAEDARDLLGENVVKYVFDKEEQIIYTDQEKTESVEDKETESLVEDEGLPSSLGSLTQDEEDLLKPLENKRLSLLDAYPNILENEGIQTPERQVIDDISKNVVEIPGTTATSEPDENIEEDEQQKCLDAGDLPTTNVFGEKEAHEIQTQSLLESVETPSGGSKEIFDDSIAHNEIGLKTSTSVNEVADEICDASEDTLQSDLLKQNSTETANHSERTVCDLPQEPSNRPAIGLVNSGDLDHITAVVTSLGSFEEMKANISELHIPAEDHSQSSDMTPYEPLNETFVKAAEFETPMLSLEIGAKPIQTLQEMAKCSLKECVELRSEQIGETMKTVTDSEDKGEVLMTGSEADNEILELNIEKEGILSQTTMETISESLNQDKYESSEHDVNRTELVEDSPDPAEAKTELLKSEVLEETQYLQGKSERYTENIKTEVGLLSETHSLDTTVEDVEKIINQVMKELIETENKCIQETPCDAEFQKPAECLPAGALLLEGEKEMLGDADQSLVQMKVETVICETVEMQKDEHDVFCPEFEPADAGCEQKERDTVGETPFSCHDEKIETDQPGLKTFDNTSKDLPDVKTEEEESLVDGSATVDLDIQQTSLDFSVQKSRIALKNPLTRPPKDPRKLINKTSTEPSLQKPPPCGLLKAGHGVGVSIQSKGVIGIKLPVIGELPKLRKTEFGQKVREEGKAESRLQVESKSVAQTENSVKQEQASLKPKWTPPKHPGMGSPLMMAELKSKLKAPVKK